MFEDDWEGAGTDCYPTEGGSESDPLEAVHRTDWWDQDEVVDYVPLKLMVHFGTAQGRFEPEDDVDFAEVVAVAEDSISLHKTACTVDEQGSVLLKMLWYDSKQVLRGLVGAKYILFLTLSFTVLGFWWNSRPQEIAWNI